MCTKMETCYTIWYCFILTVIQAVNGNGKWELVFRISSLAPGSPYELYSSEKTKDCKCNSGHCKSRRINSWDRLNIGQVKMVVRKNGSEKAFFTFNGARSSRYNWLAPERFLNSSYVDIDKNNLTGTSFSLIGNPIQRRRFSITKPGTCEEERGWLTVFDNAFKALCDLYDKVFDVKASCYILFSPYTTRTAMLDHLMTGSATLEQFMADSLEIYITEQHWTSVFEIRANIQKSAYELYIGNSSSCQLGISPTSAEHHFKSDFINFWTRHTILEVRVAAMKGKAIMAYWVFNGTGTTKYSWFDRNRLLESSYCDLHNNTNATFTFFDKSRDIRINEWLHIEDYEKPFNTQLSYRHPTNGIFISDFDGSFKFEVMLAAEDLDDWITVFRGSSDASDNVALYNLFSGVNTTCYDKARITSHYKSKIVDLWQEVPIVKVKLSIIQGGKVKAFFIFDGLFSNKESWFSHDKLLDTSYSDVNSAAGFILPGDIDKHSFMIYTRRSFNCVNQGWLMVVEQNGYECGYDDLRTPPYVIYSPYTNKVNFAPGGTYAVADKIRIEILVGDGGSSILINESTVIAPASTTSADENYDTTTGSTDYQTASDVTTDNSATTDGKIVDVTTVSYTSTDATKNCMVCTPCKASDDNVSVSELHAIIQAIQEKLKINKKALSSTIRRLTSAEDSRPSATVLGATLGVTTFAIVFSFLVLPDILSVIQFICTFLKKCFKS